MDDLSHFQIFLGFSYFFLALALLTTVLRAYTRKTITGRLGVDDWLIFVAAILAVGAIATYNRLLAVINHLNRASPEGHRDFPNALPSNHGKVNEAYALVFAWEIIYSVQFMLTKLSMLAFYLRCFDIRLGRAWIYFIGLTQIIATVVMVLMFLFVNLPIRANWDFWLSGRKANYPGERVHIGYSIYSLITDVIILTIPIPIVLRLKLKLRKKIGLILVFLLGGVTTAFTAIRLYVFIVEVGAHTPSYMRGLTSISHAAFWSVAESDLGVIYVNAPTMAALYNNLKKRVHAAKNSSAGFSWTYQMNSAKKVNPDIHPTASQEQIVVVHEVEQTSRYEV